MTAEQRSTLVQTAIELGATDAAVIASADIAIRKDLADLCNGNPRCEQYGLAPSCPPHVAGPAGFRKWQRSSETAVVVRIDLPTAVMFSDQRREIMQLLHEVAAGVEKKAIEMGYVGSRAFAGGSCLKIFCQEHADCRVLARQKECRHLQSARPSMSGFGIDVARLMQTAGWPAKKADPAHASDAQSLTWVAGLILIDENSTGVSWTEEASR